MFRTNLHWYLKFCMTWCSTWTEKILHSHFHAWQPQVTAPSTTSSYTVVTQWPPLTCCGDQVNTHNTHCIKSCWSWLHYNYTLSLLLPGWKLLCRMFQYSFSTACSSAWVRFRTRPCIKSLLSTGSSPVLVFHWPFIISSFSRTHFISCAVENILGFKSKIVSVSLDI